MVLSQQTKMILIISGVVVFIFTSQSLLAGVPNDTFKPPEENSCGTKVIIEKPCPKCECEECRPEDICLPCTEPELVEYPPPRQCPPEKVCQPCECKECLPQKPCPPEKSIPVPEPKKLRIGILIAATGKYIDNIPRLVQTCTGLLLPRHDVVYYVWTDQPIDTSIERVVRIQQPRLGWPDDSMKRFHMFKSQQNLLKTLDYVFSFDSDLVCERDIGDEHLIADLVGTTHPSFAPGNRGSYEQKNPQSAAYVSPQEGTTYFIGAFWGGKTEYVIKAVTALVSMVDHDLAMDYIPEWHDESFLNRYFIDKGVPTKVLPHTFLRPEDAAAGAYLMQLNKDHSDMRGCSDPHAICTLDKTSRKAYVTLISPTSNDDGEALYAPEDVEGARVLVASLKNTSTKVDIVVLVVNIKDATPLKIEGAKIISVNGPCDGTEPYCIYYKVLLWSLYKDYDKVVFLDTSTLVLKNIDELFNTEDTVTAVSEFIPPGDTFSTSVLVLQPSETTSNEMKNFLKFDTLSAGSEDDFLNSYFSYPKKGVYWRRLPYIYNANVYRKVVPEPVDFAANVAPPLPDFDMEYIKVLNFACMPFEDTCTFGEHVDWEELDTIWWGVYEKIHQSSPGLLSGRL